MISIGIDPGVTGAFAVLHNGVFVCAHQLPTLTVSKSKREVDCRALSRMLAEEIIVDPLHQPIFFVERVNAMPKQGVSSSFNFGCAYGMIRGLLTGWQQTIHLIAPPVWKRKAGLIGKPKDMSRTVAQNLYPAADLRLKKDVDRADAILLAHFGPDCV